MTFFKYVDGPQMLHPDDFGEPLHLFSRATTRFTTVKQSV